MKHPGRRSDNSWQRRLRSTLSNYFDDVSQAHRLFAAFLQHTNYSQSFCLNLIAIAQDSSDYSWNLRQLAVLMLEHQILKIPPHNLAEFDFLLVQLKLKEKRGIKAGVVRSVLAEGYSTTNLRQFVSEFRRRLQRLNRVHGRLNGWRTSESALREFLDLSRCACKLSLARYLFTSEEVIDEILNQLIITDGAKDLDAAQPLFVDAEAERALKRLPDFEARILNGLRQSSRVYWVSEETTSEINSLVEYPLTTVVLVIKPPGSDIEFEIKRAGRKGPFGLNVVYAHDGYGVAPSHRLDGGNMQWLLRHEARAAAKLGLIYRLVHATEAPLSHYVSRSTIYSIPARGGQVQTVTYFTDPRVMAEGYHEMREAMAAGLAAFKAEGYAKLPDLPGDLGLTAQFLSIVSPAQAILSGTSSFRLDKITAYLSSDGPQRYFKHGLNVAYSGYDARRFADETIEEILGVYEPPDVRYKNHEQYVKAAFCVPENRARADGTFLALMREIGTLCGTLMGVRGNSRGESFVARNVGLKSFWDGGQWKVRIIFMDHDSVSIVSFQDKDFYGPHALEGMLLDETYVWGRPGLMIGSVGHLRLIYRIDEDLYQQGLEQARNELKKAYQKTQRALLRDKKVRALFDPVFLARLLEWDKLVRGYLRITPGTSASSRWKDKRRAILLDKGYEEHEIDSHMEALETYRAFLERHSFVFAPSRRRKSAARLDQNKLNPLATNALAALPA